MTDTTVIPCFGFDGIESFDAEATFGPNFIEVSKPCIEFGFNPDDLTQDQMEAVERFLAEHMSDNGIPLYKAGSTEPDCIMTWRAGVFSLNIQGDEPQPIGQEVAH